MRQEEPAVSRDDEVYLAFDQLVRVEGGPYPRRFVWVRSDVHEVPQKGGRYVRHITHPEDPYHPGVMRWEPNAE